MPTDIIAARYRPKLPPLPHNFTPLNVISLLLHTVCIRPHHPALQQPEKNRSWTYLQWADRISNAVYGLRSMKISAGDKVLVLAPNTPMIADLLQAVPANSSIIVPINTRLTEPEVHYLIEHSDSKVAFVDSQFQHLAKNAKCPVIICNDTGDKNDPYEAFLARGAEHDRKHGSLGWQGIVFPADEMSTFAICYTSGTTGKPKGVEYHHRGGYLAALGNLAETKVDHDSKYLWILPMFHACGWLMPYACTAAMATQVTLRSVGEYNEIWDYFLNHNITHYSGAPTVQLSITSHPQAKRLKRKIITSVAGAAPTPKLIQGLTDIGILVTHVYGLTETYGPICRTYFVDPNHPDRFKLYARQGSAFLTADPLRVIKQITDEEASTLTADQLQEVAFDGQEQGEIITRGNITMTGYYKDTAATKKAFVAGYFRSGDVAVRYPDGSISIQDRSKDLIISGGENISSLAVENEIVTHPDVHEAAVVAEHHDKWGERGHAFVVLKPKSKWHKDPKGFHAELKQYLKPKLAGFAIPEHTTVVKELEKTSTGKVSKKVYRDMLQKQVKSKL